MRIITVSALFAFLLVSLAPQAVVAVQQQQFPGIEEQHVVLKTITPQEARILMEDRKDLVVVDVRGQDELKEGYIEGSAMMPLWDIIKGTQRPPKDKPILLICAVGGRSLALGQILSKNGWDEVYNLKGGISAWKEAKMPLQY